MGSALVNKFLYPAPKPPHYQCDSHPNNVIWVPRSDRSGLAIPCMHIRNEGAKYLVIYAHGNACDIGDMRPELQYFSHYLRVHICAFELRGYGFNKGSPGERPICSDIKDVYEYFTEKNAEGKFPAKNVIFWGRSIGSGPTTWMVSQLAERKIEAGLILQSPFTSIKDAAGDIAGKIAKAFLSNRWNNVKRIAKIKGPVLLIHGKMDKLIPHSHSEALFKACGSRNKRLVLSETADHNRFNFEPDILKPAAEFIAAFCSNSFQFGDRVNAKCPSAVYRIPDFAKAMHSDARKDKRIREVENPGSESAAGGQSGGGGYGGGAWMGAGSANEWAERALIHATNSTDILESVLTGTPPAEWKTSELIQELRATVEAEQKQISQRLAAVDDVKVMSKLLAVNDRMLTAMQRLKAGPKAVRQQTSAPTDAKREQLVRGAGSSAGGAGRAAVGAAGAVPMAVANRSVGGRPSDAQDGRSAAGSKSEGRSRV